MTIKKTNSYEIQGLGGKDSLQGTINIKGAKNAVLKAMAVTVLFAQPVYLENIPKNEDIETMIEILRGLGAKVEWQDNESIMIDPRSITNTDIDRELATKMRASIVLTGPLLARFGKVSFAMPGGCVIGKRPIDLFIEGYKKMKVAVIEDNHKFTLSSKPQNTEITFAKISVGATETLMMASILSQGTTILNNCAQEPEITSVAEWLNACGAKIRGAGTDRIEIDGVPHLLQSTVPYRAIPDRIEAGSYLILGALCSTKLKIDNCKPEHLKSVTDFLSKLGVRLESDKDSITVYGGKLQETWNSRIELTTKEYPGFPTDLQAPMVVFLVAQNIEAKVKETIFEGRFKYVDDLIAIGANIEKINNNEIIVHKITEPLASNGKLMILNAHDIRAGFAIVLASLYAKGKFVVNNVHLIDRGYEALDKKLENIGANIMRN